MNSQIPKTHFSHIYKTNKETDVYYKITNPKTSRNELNKNVEQF